MGRKFNPDEYETVKARKARFKADYPDGRIVAFNKSTSPTEYAMFRVEIYKDAEEQHRELPLSIGNALELRDWEKGVSSYGREYETVNYTSWTENCEESAIGRALDNAGYASKPSREEMQKVERASAAQAGDPLADDGEDVEALRQQVRAIVQEGHNEGLLTEDELNKALTVIYKQTTPGAIRGVEASFRERLEQKRGKQDEKADDSAEEAEQELF